MSVFFKWVSCLFFSPAGPCSIKKRKKIRAWAAAGGYQKHFNKLDSLTCKVGFCCSDKIKRPLLHGNLQSCNTDYNIGIWIQKKVYIYENKVWTFFKKYSKNDQHFIFHEGNWPSGNFWKSHLRYLAEQSVILHPGKLLLKGHSNHNDKLLKLLLLVFHCFIDMAFLRNWIF